MNIFPVERIKIRTDLSREEIQQRILDTHEYEGKASLDDFKIRRFSKTRNDFRPEIEGYIAENSYNARSIDIKMQLPKWINIFMIFWVGFVLVFGFIFLSIPFENDELPFEIFRYIPFLMLIGALPIFYFLPKMEARKSKKDLLRILDAVSVN